MATISLEIKQTASRKEKTSVPHVTELNRRSLESAALALLDDVLNGRSVGNVAMVSSFGAESAVLLDLVARINPKTPVLFLDTQMLFAETLEYKHDLATHLGLEDVRRVNPDTKSLVSRDPSGTLHTSDTNACCSLRKVEPLEHALRPFDGWITGRKRFQGKSRADLRVFEADGLHGSVKVNPLAFWEPDDLKAYFERRALPSHPMVLKGYLSIGCAPCTTPVEKGEDSRSGRWRGKAKAECGIHIRDGRVMRTGDKDQMA